MAQPTVYVTPEAEAPTYNHGDIGLYFKTREDAQAWANNLGDGTSPMPYATVIMNGSGSAFNLQRHARSGQWSAPHCYTTTLVIIRRND